MRETFERSDWPVDRIYKVHWQAGLIMVGWGRRRGWGTLAGGGSEQEVMSSGKTRWETLPWRGQLPIRNHLLELSPLNIVERTTPDVEQIARGNTPATLPLVNDKAHAGWSTWTTYIEQWRVGLILVGGGRGRGWGTLARRSKQEVGGA